MSIQDPSVTTDDEPNAEPEVQPVQGGVRWKRFAGMLTLTGALAAALVALTAQGVLASQFSISGMPFIVTADRLDGTGFEQFATIDQMIKDSPNEGDTGGQQVVIVSAINQATLTNLCQSVSLGGKFLKITAGDGKDKVAAKTLVVDSDLISGDATFNKIKIGQDSSTFNGSDNPDGSKQVDQVPGVNGGEGVFGQQADTVEILNLRQNNYATTAATFKLPHLRMTFTDDGC
jgi:hypothetical protein